MYNRATLKNGIRVIYEYIPYVKSVSVGVWVGVGSRYETPANSGISHFIEHMLFKGTKKRSAKDIAEEMDFYGGQINAFTSKEYTCFYTKTLDTHLDLSVDLLSDMYYNSVFNPQDIETERKVIIEEINMYEDSPEDLVHDLLIEKAWDGDPLAMPISGTVESVSGITRDMILSYMDKFYTPQNTVIAVAGSFDEEKLIPLLEEKFNVLRPSYNLSPFSIPEFKGG
ncbi:MAG: insulinase family protein, partial [Clostridiaceae bacterium]|nr:insulinase family protein [Clostridiaceae bacterium]